MATTTLLSPLGKSLLKLLAYRPFADKNVGLNVSHEQKNGDKA
jgi:hypothetical protein